VRGCNFDLYRPTSSPAKCDFVATENLGTSLGTKPSRTLCKTAMHDARKCLKNQLHSISGFNNGLDSLFSL
jgi:hypothetical protein